MRVGKAGISYCFFNRKPGFPLKVQGRVEKACVVTDLEGDDTLDLIACDKGGYMYAWKIGKGSIYQQPWPSEFGNSWATACKTNKPSGNVGYMYEDWKSEKVAPYSWTEYNANNSLVRAAGGNFVRDEDSGMISTSTGDKRNLFFEGPTMKAMKNYIIQGKMKFDNANAEFGVSFYGQWPDSTYTSKKYSIVRKADNVMHLLYFNGTTETDISGTGWDTSAHNDSLKNVNQWYNYEIKIIGSTVYAYVWKAGNSKPSNYGFIGSCNGISKGIVGLYSYNGSGQKYWSSVKVISAESDSGAYLANENFVEDTVVDVKPYTPASLYPEYSVNQFSVLGHDGSGFVMDTLGTRTDLLYRHKQGVEYPVTCLVAPKTNLVWRDYTVTTTIIKPDSAVYDSVEVAIPFYYQSKEKNYQLKFTMDGVKLYKGNTQIDMVSSTARFNRGDTLMVSLKVTTDDITNAMDIIQDGQVKIKPSFSINKIPISGDAISDNSDTRILNGFAGISVDYSNIQSRNLMPLRITGMSIQKAK